MDTLNREIEALLLERGADLAGVASLAGVEGAALPVGVAVGIRMPKDVVRSIADGPNHAYYDMYREVNARLDAVVIAGAEYLIGKGYRAAAQTTKSVAYVGENRTALPHKTVAVRAGLGWIGKCALLVTERYGSALRISSLLTDAPLEASRPVESSRCGDCTLCKDHCPGGAVTGETWRQGMEREALFDAARCEKTARELAFERIGKTAALCGKCIVVCPYTARYLDSAEG